jgi:hypothetical protein
MSLERPLESLSDDELLAGVADVLRASRRVESFLVAHIAEVDARRLFARHACPSMFVYCLNVLHLSEGETNLRIAVARAVREHPPQGAPDPEQPVPERALDREQRVPEGAPEREPPDSCIGVAG